MKALLIIIKSKHHRHSKEELRRKATKIKPPKELWNGSKVLGNDVKVNKVFTLNLDFEEPSSILILNIRY